MCVLHRSIAKVSKSQQQSSIIDKYLALLIRFCTFTGYIQTFLLTCLKVALPNQITPLISAISLYNYSFGLLTVLDLETYSPRY